MKGNTAQADEGGRGRSKKEKQTPGKKLLVARVECRGGF